MALAARPLAKRKHQTNRFLFFFFLFRSFSLLSLSAALVFHPVVTLIIHSRLYAICTTPHSSIKYIRYSLLCFSAQKSSKSVLVFVSLDFDFTFDILLRDLNEIARRSPSIRLASDCLAFLKSVLLRRRFHSQHNNSKKKHDDAHTVCCVYLQFSWTGWRR